MIWSLSPLQATCNVFIPSMIQETSGPKYLKFSIVSSGSSLYIMHGLSLVWLFTNIILVMAWHSYQHLFIRFHTLIWRWFMFTHIYVNGNNSHLVLWVVNLKDLLQFSCKGFLSFFLMYLGLALTDFEFNKVMVTTNYS